MKGPDRLAGRRKVRIELLGPVNGVCEKDFRKAETKWLARWAARERDYVPIGLGRRLLAGRCRDGTASRGGRRRERRAARPSGQFAARVSYLAMRRYGSVVVIDAAVRRLLHKNDRDEIIAAERRCI